MVEQMVNDWTPEWRIPFTDEVLEEEEANTEFSKEILEKKINMEKKTHSKQIQEKEMYIQDVSSDVGLEDIFPNPP